MPDLKSALYNAGLVSERQFRESEAAEELVAEEQAAQVHRGEKEKEKRLQILRGSNVPDNFRREARRLLLKHPSLVQQVINIAHERGMHTKKKKGGGRLIANLLQLRASLSDSNLSETDKVTIVDREFSNR